MYLPIYIYISKIYLSKILFYLFLLTIFLFREIMLLPGSTVVAIDSYTATEEGHITLAKGNITHHPTIRYNTSP